MEKREQARRLYAEGKSLKDIAVELGVPYPTVKSWKQRGGWGKDAGMRTDASREKDASRKRQARTNAAIAVHVDQNPELAEWEKEFCLYYVQTYNAASAAWKTGHYSNRNSARQGGFRMLQKPAVQAEIKRLKEIKRAGILADVDDLVELHMRIVFGDITDFAMWAYDPQYRSNRMAVLPSDTVDGQLVKEVSESAQGFKLKMQDKKASLDFLERFFLANPLDKHKVAYDNAKLELERQKIAEDDDPPADDGFREALNGEVWSDEEENET